MWFIGVLRDRLGEREDRFFATVFFGSGLLFLAMLFFCAAVAGGIIIAFVAAPERLLGSPTFTFGSAITHEIMNIYAIEMAGVFMIATSTLALRTGFIARWIAFLGYALSAAAPLQQPLHRRDPDGLPAVGAACQPPYPGRQPARTVPSERAGIGGEKPGPMTKTLVYSNALLQLATDDAFPEWAGVVTGRSGAGWRSSKGCGGMAKDRGLA
ncbi:MAG: hypothetical protein ACREXW_14620 [Gammaproteobacteria bacterium]